MGCLLCLICNANSFHSFLYKPCIRTNFIKTPLEVCEGWGWGQLIYIVSPDRYVHLNFTISIFIMRVQSRVWSCALFQKCTSGSTALNKMDTRPKNRKNKHLQSQWSNLKIMLFTNVLHFAFYKSSTNGSCRTKWPSEQFARPDLGPNCWKKSSTDNTRRLRVKQRFDNFRWARKHNLLYPDFWPAISLE